MSGKEALPILLTAIGGGGHGEQILKAVRLADPGRYRVFGADANPHCPQFELVEKSFVVPFASDPDYLDIVLDIARQVGAKALFHGCEPELKLFARERARIEAAGLFLPINPTDVIETCMDKVKTAAALSDLGFEVPQFMELTSEEDLSAIDFFPVVVKPAVGGGGSANCYIAQDMKELSALASLLHLDQASQTFMVQEYVGTPEEEYTVGVLHDMDGNYLNSIAVHRLLNGQLNTRLSVQNRTGRKDLGARLVISSGISHGYVDRFAEVTSQCEEIAKAIGARGPLNIQCRFVDGKVRVFEINPRFSGTTSIRAMKGYNEPDCLLRKHLFGEDIEIGFDYESGYVLRSLIETAVDMPGPDGS